MTKHFLINRRGMLKLGGLGAAGMVIEAPALGQSADYLPPSGVDIGKVENGKVVFDPWRAPPMHPPHRRPRPSRPKNALALRWWGWGG